jgi:hypothetical protein
MASPADIVTYIGIPLAVLGVSPILYNFIIAFFIKLRLKRQLKAVGLLEDTVIQSRLMNRVVEAELPVYDLELEGCPNLRAHFRLERVVEETLEAERVQGGSWTKLEYVNRDKREPRLERYLAGLITKEFQKSSKLSLPEVSVRFEDLLGYFLQNEYAPNIRLKAEGFKALKSQNFDVPVNTTLLAGSIGLHSCRVGTARSSLEKRGSLCLSIYTRLPLKIPENAKPRITRKPSNDADYFSQIEIIKWGPWMSDDAWIVEETNRYFIPEPSPPNHDKITAKEVTNDARKSVSTPAGAHELRDGRNLPTKIHTEAGGGSVEKTDLQTSKEDSLGGRDSTQSVLIERLEENPQPGSLPTVVSTEETPANGTAKRGG